MQRSGNDTQAPYLNRNTIYEGDKKTRKHNTQESQEVNSLPVDDHKASILRSDSIKKIKMKMEGYNMLNSTNLTLSLEADQNT